MYRPFSRPLARRLACWLIVWMTLVSLHSALAATLVMARGGSGAAMVEVCTNQGVRWVSVQASAGDMAITADSIEGVSANADGNPHCPLCRFLGDALPDLARSDLRFEPPLDYRVRPPDTPFFLSTAERVVLTAPPRAPPPSSG
ncbi:DUF2946 family protein [Acidovorax sp. SDU_ACID1]|uniref:DUF2946 family protein n=1 Tax=Acidovorax sp. SDU_ACID1 TaxID=3136632 RepID=UPI003873974E